MARAAKKLVALGDKVQKVADELCTFLPTEHPLIERAEALARALYRMAKEEE